MQDCKVGTPIVWVENISGYTITTPDLKRVDLTEDEKKQYLLNRGDILVTRSSHIGTNGVGVMSIVDSLHEDTVFESHIIKIKVNEQYVNPYFLTAYFRTNYCRNLIARKAKKSTMATISQPDLLKIKVILPPLDLQNKIELGIRRIEQIRQKQLQSGKQIQDLNDSLIVGLFGGKINLCNDNAKILSNK